METTLEDIIADRVMHKLLDRIDERIAIARAKPAVESLRELRERLNRCSQASTASEAGMTLKYLQALERGDHSPTKATIARLGRALGCSTEQCAAAAAESVSRKRQRKITN